MAQVENLGYSFVEVLSSCPIHQRKTPVEAMRFVGNEMTAHFPVRVFRQEGQVTDA
jgi:2-oxoglutarate ferredoxin oxidoreductase subunit beta